MAHFRFSGPGFPPFVIPAADQLAAFGGANALVRSFGIDVPFAWFDGVEPASFVLAEYASD